MNTCYLIDYNNVGQEGLSGCDKLDKTDRIVIFFAESSKSIDMNIIARHGGAKLEMIQLPEDKTEYIMQMVSYLGYYIGQKSDVELVSNDSAYDDILQFWDKNEKAEVFRSGKLVILSEKTNAKESRLHKEIVKAAKEAGIDDDIAENIADTLDEIEEKSGKLTKIQHQVQSKYKDTLDVYKIVKPVLDRYAKDGPVELVTPALTKGKAPALLALLKNLL